MWAREGACETRQRGLGFASKGVMSRCVLLLLLAACAVAAEAQTPVRIRLSLDWQFQGQTAFLEKARRKGYFAQEGLDVSIDAGNGAVGAIQRVVSGAYDAAIGDMTALIELGARGPDHAPVKAVYAVYDTLPFALLTLRGSGVANFRDLAGKRVIDTAGGSGRTILGQVARSEGTDADSIKWVIVAPAMRAQALASRAGDAVFGFATIRLELEALGIQPQEIIGLPVPRHAVDYYGNALMVSTRLIRDNPEAVRGLVRAFNQAFREAMADPGEAISYLAQRDPLIDRTLELRRSRTLRPYMLTDESRRVGFGDFDRGRIERQVEQVLASEGSAPARRPAFEELIDVRFLPPRAARLPMD